MTGVGNWRIEWVSIEDLEFEGVPSLVKIIRNNINFGWSKKSLCAYRYWGAVRSSNHMISHCIKRLKLSYVHSMTFDNGKEFSEHERIIYQGIGRYFADPYRSIQWARNENTNDLIRQFLPKSSSFKYITKAQIQAIEEN